MTANDSAPDAPLCLAEILDLKAAAGLHKSLLARRGQDLTLDGSQVSRLGGQCLQVLLAAVAAWRTDGLSLSFVNLSEALIRALHLYGAADAFGLQKEKLA
jgi:chemotaxis protein CheX